MALKKEVSLLPDSENPNSFNAKLIKWLTTVGRVAIIITEFIIVAAFISRFWLDRKNADLSEVVRQQQAILNTTVNFENDFSYLQQKLKIIKDSYANQTQYNEKIKSITESAPQDIVYNIINLQPDPKTNKLHSNISLTAYKEESIVSYITNLTLNPDINSVNIQKIEKKDKENNYSIDISLVFNPN